MFKDCKIMEKAETRFLNHKNGIFIRFKVGFLYTYLLFFIFSFSQYTFESIGQTLRLDKILIKKHFCRTIKVRKWRVREETQQMLRKWKKALYLNDNTVSAEASNHWQWQSPGNVDSMIMFVVFCRRQCHK